MITLALSEEEAHTLHDVLKSYLSDLHTEISHTDSRSFRDGLKKVETFLKGLLPRLEES